MKRIYTSCLSINNFIFFIVSWIFFTSLILPFSIITYSEDIGFSIPVNQVDLDISFIREVIVLLSSYLIYLAYFNFFSRSIFVQKYIFLDIDLINKFLGMSCSVIVLFYGIFNIISPASYEDINTIGSTNVFGGSIALATIYPLLVSIVIGTSTYIILKNGNSNIFLLWFSNLALFITALSGILSGGRTAILYPALPYLFSYILRYGFFTLIKKYFFHIIALVPILGLFIIYVASARMGEDSIFFEINAQKLNLFFIHLYLKYSGVTNSTFLNQIVMPEEYGSVFTALSGVLLTFIPRFIYFDKPISGSLNGLETGLPYRIAANLLGYEDFGNVVLSPATLSYWLAGNLGVIINALTISVLLIMAHTLIRRGIMSGSPVFIGLAFYLIGMPHFISFYVDFTQGLSIILRIVIIYIILIVIKKTSAKLYI